MKPRLTQLQFQDTGFMRISLEPMPGEELALRHARCRALLDRLVPQAGGLLAFARTNMYYLSGVMGAAVFWLPKEGKPIMFVRKGLERARLDSPSLSVVAYRSYADLAPLASELGSPFPSVIAAERSGLSWALAENLQQRVKGVTFVSGDAILPRARAVKTAWELVKMREAGRLHAEAMEYILPHIIEAGMTEMEIARKTLRSFADLNGIASTRMSNFGEELILGAVSVGDNGNYPTFYNGPLGGMGSHPSMPFLGCPKTVWTENTLLMIDVGFNYEGYNSDKSISYFSGDRRSIPAVAQKAHDLCRRIEEDAARSLKPGALPMDIYRAAVAEADKAGFAEGFMGHGGNQVPFLGHGIGLCIDDWPPIADRFDTPIEDGMTFALEPKVGLPGIGMVGTENSWLVTPAGGECLTGGIRDIVCLR